MSDTPPPLPPSLRLLRVLVTVLTVVMIAGVITIVALLVTRLPGATVRVPPALALPEGAEAHAVTTAPGYWIVTTTDGRVLIFGPDGALRGDVPLE